MRCKKVVIIRPSVPLLHNNECHCLMSTGNYLKYSLLNPDHAWLILLLTLILIVITAHTTCAGILLVADTVMM